MKFTVLIKTNQLPSLNLTQDKFNLINVLA